MNVQDAFYSTVHSFPGGCEALAVRLQMSAAVLRNKANPNTASNTPSLAEADRIIGITGDPTILHALAASHGFVCVKVPDDADASDMAVLEMLAQVMATNGAVGAEIHSALADGKVTPDEVEKVRQAARRAERALEAVTYRLDKMAG